MVTVLVEVTVLAWYIGGQQHCADELFCWPDTTR